MSEIREGGCLCGAIRYRVKGQPVRAYVCHCTFCQKRTSAAFSVNAWFEKDSFELMGEDLGSYEHRSDETDNLLRLNFCRRCATVVFFEPADKFPEIRAITCGTLDDPNSIEIDTHTWARSAVRWMLIPENMEIRDTSSPPATAG